jgi:hypothetical protein
MEKKISTKEEQAIGWLKNEIEKDKIELESQKRQLIESIKDGSCFFIYAPVYKKESASL